MQEFITPQQWLLLPQEVKNHLIKTFDIKRTGISEVRDNTVISDGYTQTDLKAITHAAMKEYIGSDETFLRSWELTLAKVKFELNPPVAKLDSTNKDTPVEVINNEPKKDAKSK